MSKCTLYPPPIQSQKLLDRPLVRNQSTQKKKEKKNMVFWLVLATDNNKHDQTRNHVSRMHTACLPTAHAFLAMPPDVSTSGGQSSSEQV